MQVQCEQCGATYPFDRSKVSTTNVRIQCTQCGHQFELAEDAPETRPPRRNPTIVGIAPIPSAPMPPSERKWNVRVRSTGELRQLDDLSELRQLVTDRMVAPEDEISRSGDVWKRLGDVSELASLFHVIEQTRSGNLPSAPSSAPSTDPLRGSEASGPSLRQLSSGEYPTIEDRADPEFDRPKRSGRAVLAATAVIFVAGAVAFAVTRDAAPPPPLPPTVPVAALSAPVVDLASTPDLTINVVVIPLDATVSPSDANTASSGADAAATPSGDTAAARSEATSTAASATKIAPPSPATDREPLPPAPAVALSGSELLAQGNRALEYGKIKEAQRSFERLLSDEPNNADALTGLGYCLLNTERFGGAIDRFREALAKSPGNGDAILGIAEAYKMRGDREHAVEYYRKYITELPSGSKRRMAESNIADLEAENTPPAAP